MTKRTNLIPSPPSKSLDVTSYDWGDLSFVEYGPRGGFYNMGVPKEALPTLDDVIADQMGWPYRCKGCGRAENDCSAEPCDAVLEDRGDD